MTEPVKSVPPSTPPFPDIQKPLLDELNRRYPPRCPETDWTDRRIWLEVGARKVVEFLNHQFERQNEKRILNHG